MKERESGGSQGIKRKENNSKNSKKKEKTEEKRENKKTKKKRKEERAGCWSIHSESGGGKGGGENSRREREKEGRKDNPAQISSIFFLFPSLPFHLLLLALSPPPPTRYRHVDHDIIPPIPSLRLLPKDEIAARARSQAPLHVGQVD